MSLSCDCGTWDHIHESFCPVLTGKPTNYDDEPEYEYQDSDEPDLDFGFEHDSAMVSAGMGTDEDYGYYGEDDYS